VRGGWAWGWLLLWCWSCAGDLKDPDRFDFVVHLDASVSADAGSMSDQPDAALPDCIQTLFSKTCGVVGCHSAGTPQIDLVSDGLIDRVVDQLAPDKPPTSKCEGKTLVSSDGSASLLVDKLKSSPPCGSPMPFGVPATSDQVKCVTDWVTSLQKSGGK
jgi:hypothetical protein